MPTNRNPAIELLADLSNNDDINTAKMKATDIPSKPRSVLKKAFDDRRISLDDVTDVVKVSYFDDERVFYVVAVSNSDAEVYNGVFVVQEDTLIGVDEVVSS